MSFLRSVIADARPRKPMLESSDGPSALTGWKTRGLDGDAFKAEEKSPSAADKTSCLSKSLSIRESASDFNMGDAPTFQADNPVNQGIQDFGSNVEPESPLSAPVDKSGPIPDEESSTHLGTGNLPDREPDSEGGKASITERDMPQLPAGTIIPDSRMNSPKGPDNDSSIASPETHGAQNRAFGHEETEPLSSPASIKDMPGKELTDNDGNSSLQAVEGTGQLGVGETMPSAAEGNTPAQGEVVGVTAADNRHHSESSIKDPETLTIQADATQTIDLTSPESSRRIESSVLEASGQVSGQASMPDNSAGGNEVEKALADGGKARQVSPSVDKQADMKSLSNQEDIPRLQKPDEAKGVVRDVQLISRRAMAMDSHISSDMELASVPQSAGKKVSTSASSPGSGPSKPGSPVQHIARPARPSVSPEALRSVPARPFHADLMPKDGDSFHSRAPLRSPEKKHEAPKVQIGQIDVIIEAAAQPATKPAPAPSLVDLASRHYLRRL